MANLRFFLFVAVVLLLWVPFASWMMPQIADAPTWETNPMWYITAALMAVAVAYALRRIGHRPTARDSLKNDGL